MSRSQFSLDVSSLTSAAGAASGAASGSSDLPPQLQEAETAIVAMVPATAQKYVAQGEALVNAADEASKGDYSGLIAAAEGIVNDFPPGDVRQAVDDVLNIAGSAAKGEEIGQMLGPYGAIVGTIVGAIVGFVEDIFSSPPPVIQNDFRNTGDTMIFPGVAKGTMYSLVPGAANRNPRDQNDSIFYTLDGVPLTTVSGNVTNQNIAEDFGFGVSYLSPPKSTPSSKYMAWLLAQVYIGTDSVTLANALAPANKNKDPNGLPARSEDVKSARLILGTLLGGPTYVEVMVKRVEQLYGARAGWDTTLPSSLPQPVTKAIPTKAFYQAHMLDWLYYPVYVCWNGSVYNFCQPSAASDVFLCVDPSLLQICECAILRHNDVVVLHMVMAKIWLRKRGLLQDAVKMPGLDVLPHPNFSRIVGLISERLRNTLRMHRKARGITGGGSLKRELANSRKAGFAKPGRGISLFWLSVGGYLIYRGFRRDK